jgi:hypothetical protein
VETASHLTCDSGVGGSSTSSLTQSPVEASVFMGLITNASVFGVTARSLVSELVLSVPHTSVLDTSLLLGIHTDLGTHLPSLFLTPVKLCCIG